MLTIVAQNHIFCYLIALCGKLLFVKCSFKDLNIFLRLSIALW